MAPRDRQRFRERFRREPRVEANGGGERKLMKIRDLSRHAAPLRQIVRKLTFDRILFSTEPRPATLSVDQLPLKALIKVLIRFPLNGGVAPLFPGPSLARNSCSLSEPVLSSSGKKYWDGSIFGWFLMMRSSRNKYGEMDLEWLLREIG